jgi:tetrahydromethanopterin S-methyltransferase subunit A
VIDGSKASWVPSRPTQPGLAGPKGAPRHWPVAKGPVGLGDLNSLVQILCLQKQECGNGPFSALGGAGALRSTIGIFRRENMGIELVAGAVLASSLLGGFLGAAVFVGLG